MASDPLYKPDSASERAGPESAPPTRANRLRGLSETPAFYLIYLVFYFTPWFFQLPGLRDALIGFAAVGSFIPVYLYANAGDPYRNGVKPVRTLMAAGYASALSLALIPVVGMSGNFHIYAVTLLAGLRPQRVALLARAGLSAFYLCASWLLGATIFEMCCPSSSPLWRGWRPSPGLNPPSACPCGSAICAWRPSSPPCANANASPRICMIFWATP